MSHRKEYDLNVSYPYGAGEDDPVMTIAETHGFLHTAGGGGFGSRDLHFSRPAPPTDAECEAITAALKALPFPVSAGVETWTYDENDEVVGDTVGHCLIEMEDA